MSVSNHPSGIEKNPASYRDPSGYVFTHEGIVYRQVNQSFAPEYDRLMQSGAYNEFLKKQWLIAHEETDKNLSGDKDHYKTLCPQQLPFISYAYEWSFSMLQDAALLTLDLAINGIEYGLLLKDATPANVQWMNGRPVFIDTLSFARYDSRQPWIAYRQFCECFLSPLVLMHYTGKPLQQLMLAFPEGIPLSTTARLLPMRSRFNLNVFLHIHLNAKMSGNSTGGPVATASFSKTKMLNLLQSLGRMVTKLSLAEKGSVWAGYYDEAGARNGYLAHKKEIVTSVIARYPAVKKVADLGANEGEFALLAAKAGKQVLAADLDPFCIERLYKRMRGADTTNLFPLVLDLANASPGNGFSGTERASFTQRCRADLIIALALVHHLVIGRNIPFSNLAAFLAPLSPYLVIEFVPMDDPKASLLAAQKKIGYEFYTADFFLKEFEQYYSVLEQHPVRDSSRVVFVMQRRY